MRYAQLLAGLEQAQLDMRAAMEQFARAASDMRAYCADIECLSKKLGEANSELGDRIYELEHPEGTR